MKQKHQGCDIVACGGGLAGFCAVIAAARQGASTCLVRNRPVLGGNSPSEIGVTTVGLRVVVSATNGDPSASICEIRC